MPTQSLPSFPLGSLALRTFCGNEEPATHGTRVTATVTDPRCHTFRLRSLPDGDTAQSQHPRSVDDLEGVLLLSRRDVDREAAAG